MATDSRMRPQVSVIIPMFNAAATIERAVRSCLDQTEQNIEVLVVDDGSTDTSQSVVSRVTDRRVRLIVKDQNTGPADARNLALARARGEWVTFLDADDYYLPTRLAVMLSIALREPTHTVIMDRLLTSPAGSRTEVREFGAADILPNRIGGQPLIHREHIARAGARFPSSVHFGEDTAFLLMVMSVPGSRLVILPDQTYCYIRGSESLTRRPDRYLHLMAAYGWLLDYQQLDPGIRSQIVDSLDQLQLEHAYETIQDELRRGSISKALLRMWSTPAIIPLAFKRAPRAAALIVRRVF